ncbi:MAG: hypothetical protein HQL73_03650 [Magnetococcales bacterium]|nr:hypothetical protein [Magnetococcales bacterium]
MSLINQVLSDLSERQATLAGPADLFALGLSPVANQTPEKKTSRPFLLLIIGLMVLFSVSLMTWRGISITQWFKHQVDRGKPVAETQVSVPEPTPGVERPESNDTTAPAAVAASAPAPQPASPGSTSTTTATATGTPSTHTATITPEATFSPSGVMSQFLAEEESVAPSGVVTIPALASEGPLPGKDRAVATVNPPVSHKQMPASTPLAKKNKLDSLPLKQAPVIVTSYNKAAPANQVQRIQAGGGNTTSINNINNIEKLASVGLERSQEIQPPTPVKPEQGANARTNQGVVPQALETVMPLQKVQSLSWARTLLEDGQLDEAERVVREQAGQEGESAAALGIMAVVEQKRGNLESSNRYYNRLVRLEPDQYRWWLGLAINMDHAKRRSEAASFYKHVIKMNPADTQVVRFAQDRLRILEDRTAQARIP